MIVPFNNDQNELTEKFILDRYIKQKKAQK